MIKLPESIPSTNVKIIEIYNKIDSSVLNMSPDFQRKLVWKKQHKYHFIETILKNFPFPEVYIASSEIDITRITSTEVVVDGQQRLSTIVDYIKGLGDFKNQKVINSFSSLENSDKKDFLNYLISVRDLKDMELKYIKEVFMRINNTEYSLNAVEKTNAQYGDGEFVMFCKQLAEESYNTSSEFTDSVVESENKIIVNNFFSENKIFSNNDARRMNNLQFMMTLISTFIENEYFSRNSKVLPYIKKYNEEFPTKKNIEEELISCLLFIKSINLEVSSYWFNKSNVFTLIIELSKYDKDTIDKNFLLRELNTMDIENKKYFSKIEDEGIDETRKKYFEFAKEAVNEKKSREHRGSVVKEILEQCKKI